MPNFLKPLLLSLFFTLSLFAQVNCEQTQKVQSFVERFYTVVLSRSADNAGLDDWTNKLTSGALTGADVANGFVLSQEFTNKNTTDETYLHILYKAFFNREADQGGFDGWMGQLNSGTTRQEVLHGFLYSQEFINLANSYGIKAYEGAAFSNSLLTDFVKRFYSVILGREADTEGLNDWTTQLSTGESTGADIAKGFIFSNEYNIISKTNTQYLTDLYRAFFNREPDSAGFEGWMEQLQSGTPRQEVLDGFLGSQEFIDLTNSFGIVASEGAPTLTPTENLAPIAQASYRRSGNSIVLDANGSTDEDGTIVCHWWVENEEVLGFEERFSKDDFSEGIHTVRLTVVDDAGVSGSESVNLFVADWRPNQPPVADAGEDKIAIVGKPRTIVGYGSDLDGYAIHYEWKKDDEVLATSSSFIYTPTEEANTTLTFTVTDDRGATSSDTIRIVSKEETAIDISNLLEGNNPNVAGTAGFVNVGEGEAHAYVSDESHTNDDSGSIRLVEHWYNHPITTSTFRLEKDKLYTFGAYMKAVGDDKGQNVMFKIKKDSKNSMELNYNISKAGQWEEVAIPYRAKEAGNYTIAIFTHRYAITTDEKDASSDGSNIDRNASILLDDFFVYETKEDEGVKTNEPITPKVPFESSMVKIDALGNWQIQENGEWKDFFPKFVYRDFTDIAESARKYSAYGFTGFANIPSVSQMHAAVDNGMKYNAVQVNKFYNSIKKAITDIIQDINDDKLPAISLIAYTFDNESLPNYTLKKTVSEWINDHDNSNPITGKRDRPIFMLNGIAEGVARNYKNHTGKDYMDVVGTYVTQSGEAINKHETPINTLSTLQKQHHQIAPVSIMQLQCYYKDTFIPSVFKGIADGAKGLTFWRAGKGDPVAHGCPENFEDNVWAPAIKDTFAKIDERRIRIPSEYPNQKLIVVF